jgi:hypothetical protein
MRFRTLLITSLLTSSLPLVSQAQTNPHFYVGAGANLLTNVPFNSAGAPRLVGPSLTAGVLLTSRLALQASASYHWKKDSYTSPSYNYGQTGTVGGDTYSNQYKYFMVPVLLRYTFTPSTEHFHFDGLAGVTVLHSTYHYESTALYPGDYNSSLTRASLSLGPAARYTLTPKVELTANALVSAALGDGYYQFSDRLFLNVLVGAHYTFGQI